MVRHHNSPCGTSKYVHCLCKGPLWTWIEQDWCYGIMSPGVGIASLPWVFIALQHPTNSCHSIHRCALNWQSKEMTSCHVYLEAYSTPFPPWTSLQWDFGFPFWYTIQGSQLTGSSPDISTLQQTIAAPDCGSSLPLSQLLAVVELALINSWLMSFSLRSC